VSLKIQTSQLYNGPAFSDRVALLENVLKPSFCLPISVWLQAAFP